MNQGLGNLQNMVTQLFGSGLQPEDYAKVNKSLQTAYLKAGVTVLEGYTDALKTVLGSVEAPAEGKGKA